MWKSNLNNAALHTSTSLFFTETNNKLRDGHSEESSSMANMQTPAPRVREETLRQKGQSKQYTTSGNTYIYI